MYINVKMYNMKIKEIIEYGKTNLIKKEESYRLSKILIKHFLNVNDTYLVINANKEVEITIFEFFKSAIQLLNNGTPLQYITNKQEFMGLEFYVDENVLIPQPDTEILVEETIKYIKPKDKILDLCTGSGAIGISLAKNTNNTKIYMSDVSKEALDIARENAIRNNVIEKCKLIHSDMFKDIKEEFNIIVSNPPYIKTDIINTLDKEVQKEPYIALNGGKDGLDFYRIIITEAYKYLKKDGVLALEIGYDQRKNVINLLNRTEKYKDIYCKKDLGGNDRVVIAKV